MIRLAWLILAVSMTACTTRPVEPTRASRRIIDSTFQQIVSEQQPGMDSLCRVYGDSLYRVAVDSLRQEREAEMKSLVK